MREHNPSSKDIDIKTQEGLEKLKIKAKYYGHYADFLLVPQLIQEIEELRKTVSVACGALFDKLE